MTKQETEQLLKSLVDTYVDNVATSVGFGELDGLGEAETVKDFIAFLKHVDLGRS